MATIFLKLLNMSAAASWLILAVVLLRMILKKMPKSMRCLLWAMVAVRLLCPVSMESALSLIPNPEPVTKEDLYEQRPQIESGVEIFDESVGPILSETLAADPENSVNPLQVLIFAGSYLWIIGVAVMGMYAFISYQRVRKQVRFSVSIGENQYICDDIGTPFILGIIRPRIYLPSSMEQENLAHVVAHEKAHIKRRDHLWKPMGFAILTVYWFNPLVWLAYIMLCRDIELACDERVIREMGIQEKKAYSEALLTCSISRRMVPACPLAFGEVGVRERIQSVLQYKKPAFRMVGIATLALVLVAVCFLTDPEEKQLFGVNYTVEEVLYDAPQYSFTYTVENAPEYSITEDKRLFESHGIYSGSSQTEIGVLKEVKYSRQELYTFFEPLNNKAHENIDKVEKCWRVDVGNENESFYLVMETRDDDILIAVGHGGDHIRWLWDMEAGGVAYDYADLEKQIEEMRGQESQIFALYSIDNDRPVLLAGYQSSGTGLGLATFIYDNTTEQKYRIKGCRDFGGASLYSMTIMEEDGIDQSITVALSAREDLAEVRAVCEGEELSLGVSGCPGMTVFEWWKTLPEDAKVEVIFYNAASEELKRDGTGTESTVENDSALSNEADGNALAELLLPKNSNWIKNPVYSVEDGIETIQYRDGICEMDLTLVIGEDSALFSEMEGKFDENQEETWSAQSKSGEYVEIKVRIADFEDGRNTLVVSWEYDGKYYVISGDFTEKKDFSPVAKTAIHIIAGL